MEKKFLMDQVMNVFGNDANRADEEFTVKIKPLTPIWTGDVKGKNTTLRESGIIGSLRWWYEALIRGLGGTACDPTNSIKSRCNERNHCDACELFGCTGWGRKFRLEVDFNTTVPEVWIGTRRKYRKRNVSGFMSDGSITLNFIPLREISKNEWDLMNATIRIIENYGALGAHTPHGNGVIKIIENNLPEPGTKIGTSELKKRVDGADVPSLKDFSFYKFKLEFKEDILQLIDKKAFWTHDPAHRGFEDKWDNWKRLWDVYNLLPIAFHVRDTIRRFETNDNMRHDAFGKLGKGSKVFVSHGYRIDDKTVKMRIWDYDVKRSLENKIEYHLENRLREKLFSSDEYSGSCHLTKKAPFGCKSVVALAKHRMVPIR